MLNTTNSDAFVNRTWSKTIPTINKVFTTISVTIFLLSLFVAVQSGALKEVFLFALIMVAVIIILGRFNYIESSSLSKKYSHSTSKMDPWFIVVSVIRNIVFVLNVIPFIQIFGIVALVLGTVPYLLIYLIMIYMRNKSISSSQHGNFSHNVS